MKETIITLENETHRAQIYLNRGAKTGSFMLKSTGFELLAQPKDARYPLLRPGMPFSEGDASGFDDVFPSMGEEIVILDGRERSIPDHGEIWTLPMRAEISENMATFTGNGRVFPYTYQKRVSLEMDTLRYSYQIANRGQSPLPCVWVCHCLMRLEAGVRFEFPERSVELVQLFPDAETVVDRRNAERDYCHPPAPGRAMKFYFTEPVREGRCAAYYPQSGTMAEMLFDPETLPYLGFWITTGGYRGDQNFAFEPSNGYFDTIQRAKRQNRLRELAPGDKLCFDLAIRLRENIE